MRLFHPLRPTVAAGLTTILLSVHISLTQGVNFTTVPSANLDLSQLGRVALAGDFDAISIYSYLGQNENPFSTNGSQSLWTQLPQGQFEALVSADAFITTMCPFVRKTGDLAGVIVGGNFTSLGGIETQGVALFDPSSGSIIPLEGLSGSVNSIVCDQDTDSIYIGGDFSGGNSTNAIVWVGMTGWTNLPFAGFNGPVYSVVKAPSGKIIFGGSFTGLGNNTATPSSTEMQVVNLASADITSGGSASTAGFNSPSSIICQSADQDGAGTTWLLQDNTPGFWNAQMSFGFEPSKLRLYNTHYQGRGTQTWRYTAYPEMGIMNMSYTDPTTNQTEYCQSTCPLSNDPSIPFQDFYFVNVIGMDSFQIDISAWYGSGGGLDGIELFQNDIYTYAVSSLDEPACAAIPFASNATTTGPWTVTPSGDSVSEYLTADLTGPNVDSNTAQVVFLPDIKQSGNYTVIMYTPGCQQTNSCASRGIASITGQYAAGAPSVQTQIYQTNEFEKYDQIYNGFIDAGSASFRPSVTLSPLANQNSSITLVALRIRFVLLDATSNGLNGLYDFDPNLATASTDYSDDPVDIAGNLLSTGAVIFTLAVVGQNTYMGGSFQTNTFQNIFALVDGNATSLPGGGLNDPVSNFFVFGNLLYVGGNFTNTVTVNTTGINNVAAYDTSGQIWSALGAGVNGPINTIVPLLLNITAGVPETCITVNGDFDQILAFGSNSAFSASDGLAIWVPSHQNWLQNLDVQTMSISGKLTYSTNISDAYSPILAGAVMSQGMALGDTAELSSSSGTASLASTGLKIQAQSAITSIQSKRAVGSANVTGIVTGLFDTSNGRNLTILGGHFVAVASNGSTINSLAILNTTSGSQTSTGFTEGITSDSSFLALAVNDDTLYAGGVVTGTVGGATINGLVLWDLATASFASPQLPPLVGSTVVVNAISTRPSSSDLYVAGDFDAAGSITCPSMCVYTNGQWSRPGTGFSGTVQAFLWQGTSSLLVAGSLTVGGNSTNLATYNVNSQMWADADLSAVLPGPVTTLTPANSDSSQYWVAGTATNGSAFLMHYDGSTFQSVGDIFGQQTSIRGLSVLSLSQNHQSTNIVPANMALLVTGAIDIIGFGNASAALYNGTTFTPFILSTSSNTPGSLSQLFSEQQQSFSPPGGHLAVGFVVLIALAIALVLICLLIIVGLIVERQRKKREGYRPAPQNYFEKTTNMGRIPPEHLFGNLGRGPGGPMTGPQL